MAFLAAIPAALGFGGAAAGAGGAAAAAGGGALAATTIAEGATVGASLVGVGEAAGAGMMAMEGAGAGLFAGGGGAMIGGAAEGAGLAGIMGKAMSIAGNLGQIAGNFVQGTDADSMRLNAEIARLNAIKVRRDMRRKELEIEGAQEAVYGSSGVAADVGTPLQVKATTARDMELEAIRESRKWLFQSFELDKAANKMEKGQDKLAMLKSITPVASIMSTFFKPKNQTSGWLASLAGGLA